jgi:hypothetical protein
MVARLTSTSSTPTLAPCQQNTQKQEYDRESIAIVAVVHVAQIDIATK